MSKKNLSNASQAAVNKFFSQPEETSSASQPSIEYTNSEYDTKDTKDYHERGKREVRHGLLLDKQLKEDLINLCNANGNRSMNDYIVKLLIEHTEQPANKKLIGEFKKLKSRS
jgi:hypothetical protein